MRTEPRSLSDMQNRLTSYEVIARHEDGRQVRLGFSERRTKAALLSLAQTHGETLLDWLGSWDGIATYSKDRGWQFGPVQVRFSGKTERDCANELSQARRFEDELSADQMRILRNG